MKSPLVHFALLGLVLFFASRWLFPSERTERPTDTRIVVSTARVAALVTRYEETSGAAATDDVRAELIQRFAEEEMLYREARRWGLAEDNPAVDLRLRQVMEFVSDEEHSDLELERRGRALGLDSKDAVIRNMLVHNMRLLLSRNGEREPTGEEIEAYYEREGARFARSSRVSGWHVFFSKDLRQALAMSAARAARANLDAEPLPPEGATGLGDVFPSGARFEGHLSRQLASRFGEHFAQVAESLPEGQWSDPVETPFGVHLVLVEERSPSEVPRLADARARVVAAYESSRREERLASAMKELRARYEVVVE
jgi:hypothetical protein